MDLQGARAWLEPPIGPEGEAVRKQHEHIAALRGLADAAYGCGDWLAGASLLAQARRAEAIADAEEAAREAQEQDQIAGSDRSREREEP